MFFPRHRGGKRSRRDTNSLHDKSAHGVAWGADIAMFAIPVGDRRRHVPPHNAFRTGRETDAGWGDLFDYVFAWRGGGRGADVLNLSIGFSGIIDSYSEQELRDHFGMAIAAMAQAGAGDKTILVWAAGNAHGDPCDPCRDRAVRRQQGRCGLGGGAAGPGRPHRRVAGTLHRRRRPAGRRSHCGLLQPLRHCRRPTASRRRESRSALPISGPKTGARSVATPMSGERLSQRRSWPAGWR